MGVSFGIDVSYANGRIDWNKVKPHIDFAMIRAGYGSKTIDTKFKESGSKPTSHDGETELEKCPSFRKRLPRIS